MNSFTLWFDHYHQTEIKDVAFKTSVGITSNEIHVKHPEGEFWITIDDLIDYVCQNGQECDGE